MGPTFHVLGDDGAMQGRLKAYLERMGYTVYQYASIISFTHTFRTFGSDCVIADLGLGRSCSRLIRRIRAITDVEGYRTPIVVMSTLPAAMLRRQTRDEGVDGTLRKPFDIVDLTLVIDAVTRRM